MSGYILFLWWFKILLASVVGLISGSFTTMLVYRLPRDLPIARFRAQKSTGGDNPNRSRCPACHHELGIRDLLPLFSWILQKGRCRYCKAHIGMTYFLVELSCLVLCVAAYAYIGHLELSLYILWAVVPVLVGMVFIDWHHQILPDALNIALGLLGLVYHGNQAISLEMNKIGGSPDVYTSILLWLGFALVSGLIYAGFAALLRYAFLVVRKKEALGMGDVKFFMAAGIWLGVETLPWFLLLSGVLGVVFGVVYRLVTKQQRFPFGPALIAALVVAFYFPSPF